jgi:thiol-disulfide isomerase/thioredoxin
MGSWYDGDKVHSIREKDKQIVESAWDESDESLSDGSIWALTWAARWKSLVTSGFAQSEGAPGTRHEGEASVEGVPCDVVHVDYSESNDPFLYDAWWYIARSDSLPRRLDLHFIDTGKGDGFSVTVLSDLKADQALDKAALAMKPPEGYQVKSIEPPERKRAASAGSVPAKPAGPQVGAAAPDWTLTDAAGKEHKLSDYKGKVVVLDFWATWCGPCKAAMPGVQAIHDKYKGKGVAVFGMNCWENSDAPKYMKDNKYTYGLLLKADEVAGKYGVSGIPTIYVIGTDGKVLYQSTGFAGEEAVEAAIEKGLKP